MSSIAQVTTACGVHDLPPAAPPPPTVPEIPEVPSAPPREGTGRLLVTSEGEPAKVSRVTESWEGLAVEPNARYRYRSSYPGLGGRKTELLCLAPCAVDLPTGAHSLVFTSTVDPARTSTVDVAVPQGTTVLRHAVGYEKPYSAPYVLGAVGPSPAPGWPCSAASRC